VCDIVVKRFTFAIASPDEFLVIIIDIRNCSFLWLSCFSLFFLLLTHCTTLLNYLAI